MRGARAIFLLAALLVWSSQTAWAQNSWRQRASASQDDVTRSDITEEVRFGREVAARILGRLPLYDNPEITKYVNLVGQSVVMNTGRTELEFRFAVLDTGDINAYAAPGGYIFITKGALEKAQDEAELAGVLAHEIAHVTERHIVKELNIHGAEDSAVSGLARLIGGASDTAKVAFFQAAEKALEILFRDGYKREDEVQADKNAAAFTAITGYDPAALARYLERISTLKGKQTEVLDKTHPPTDARIVQIKEAIAKGGLETAGAKIGKERFASAMKALK